MEKRTKSWMMRLFSLFLTAALLLNGPLTASALYAELQDPLAPVGPADPLEQPVCACGGTDGGHQADCPLYIPEVEPDPEMVQLLWDELAALWDRLDALNPEDEDFHQSCAWLREDLDDLYFTVDDAYEAGFLTEAEFDELNDAITSLYDAFRALDETPLLGAAGPGELPDGTDEADQAYIVVGKKFVGLPEGVFPSDFQLRVESKDKSYDLRYGGADGIDFEEIENPDGTVNWQWRIQNADVGTYSATETVDGVNTAEVPGYFLTASGIGDEIVIETTPMDIADGEMIQQGQGEEVLYQPGAFLIVQKTGDLGKGFIVFTENQLTATQRVSLIEALKANPACKLKLEQYPDVSFYSVKGELVPEVPFNITGNIFTLHSSGYKDDPSKPFISVDLASGWSTGFKGVMEPWYPENPEIDIVNTYDPMGNVTVSKNVTGNMGDRKEEFEFTVDVELPPDRPAGWVPTESEDGSYTFRWTGENRLLYTFYLKDGQRVTIPNLPKGASLTLTETPGRKDYTVLVRTDPEGEPLTAPYTFELWEDLYIDVENHLEIPIDVGVRLDSLPYLLILAAAALGVIVLVVRKRHDRDDD